MKHSQYLAPLALAALLGVGCTPESGDRQDCVGFNCPAGLLWPDGGEIRIQYIGLPDGSDLRFLVGFFVEEQDPEFLPPPVLGQCFVDSNYVPDSRVYKDIGESIQVNMAGQTVTAPRVMGDQAIDFIGRRHRIAYITQTYEDVPDGFFDNEHFAETPDPAINNHLRGMYMPPAVEVLKPEPAGVRTVKASEDLHIEYREVNPPNPDIMTAAVILFWKTGQPGDVNSEIIACVGPNTGEFVVPKETIDSLPDAGGIMQVGTISNQAVLTEDERRIDLWASNCIAFPWTKVE